MFNLRCRINGEGCGGGSKGGAPGAETAIWPKFRLECEEYPLWSASKKIKVVRKKGGMDGGWYWRLPVGSDPALPGEDSKSPEGSEDSLSEKLEPLESSAVVEAANELVEVEL